MGTLGSIMLCFIVSTTALSPMATEVPLSNSGLS